MFTRSNDRPIGIDLGVRSIKAAQLAADGTVRAIALPRRELGPDDAVRELSRLRGVLVRNGLNGRRVVAACPPDKVMIEPLRLPPASSGAPLAELAKAELARIRQLQPETFEVGYWEVPTPSRGGDGSHVLAAACRHTDANAAADLFEAAGFEVAALDTAGCAAARGCASAIEGLRGIVALIDLGWDAIRLTLMHQGVIVFERANSDAGLGRLLAAVGKTLSLEEKVTHHLCWKQGLTPIRNQEGDDPSWHAVLAEAQSLIVAHFDSAAHELSMAFSYAGHRYPDAAVEQAVLIGGGAMMPGVPGYLGSVLGLPTAPLQTDELLADDALSSSAPLVAHAIGLARSASQTRGVAA